MVPGTSFCQAARIAFCTLSGSGNLLLSSSGIAESGDGELSAAGLTFFSALATSPIRLGDGH